VRAAFYERNGAAAEVLEVGDIPDLVVGPGEVLVALEASGVNPSDVKARAGSRGMAFERIVPHSDGAGTVEAVGAGVPADLVGQRVWLWEAQWGRAWGTAAEHTVVPARCVAPLPEAASFEEGACLGIPALTAHRCLFADGPVDGKAVLVSGATGRVGAYAVQLAKHGGALVLATVGSDDKAERAGKFGADHVFNYRADGLAEQVLDVTGGRGVDRIVDAEFGANLAVDTAMLAANGAIATYASMAEPTPTCAVYPLMLKNAVLRFVLVYDMPEEAKQQAAREVNDLLAAGRLQHQIAVSLSLDEIVAAHQAIEASTAQGCVVLRPRDN
jgi:NADPH:quinone reductase-like Zn-dependent oxidoreductase